MFLSSPNWTVWLCLKILSKRIMNKISDKATLAENKAYQKLVWFIVGYTNQSLIFVASHVLNVPYHWAPVPHTSKALQQLQWHSHMAFKNPQSTCRMVGHAMHPPVLLVQCTTTRVNTTFSWIHGLTNRQMLPVPWHRPLDKSWTNTWMWQVCRCCQCD